MVALMVGQESNPEECTTVQDLRSSGIQFVRVVTCCNANIIRTKAIYIDSIERLLVKAEGIGWTEALQSLPVMADAVAEDSGLTPVGEVFLSPDWNTLQVLPYHPSHARVFGDFHTSSGDPWTLCTRHFLKRMIAQAAELGYSIKAAFEPEFYLLSRNAAGEITGVDDDVYAAVLAMDKSCHVMDEIANALMKQGLTVETYHPESGTGQQELTLKYVDALAAADQHIIYRETVKAIAYKHGLIASFMPKIFPKQCGSGNHLHISVWKDGVNVLPDNSHTINTETGSNDSGLSISGQQFVAGILHSLNGLMPLVCPSTNSYRRMKPSCWAGAYNGWGVNNKEAAVRVCTRSQPNPNPTNVEIKPVDGSSNPYLALGGIIAAGLDGIREKRQLSQRMDVDPATLSVRERETRHLECLPETLMAAVKAFHQCEMIKKALGEPLAQAIAVILRANVYELLQPMHNVIHGNH
eukprot:CFRG5238T1